jgi:hypothetical protein
MYRPLGGDGLMWVIVAFLVASFLTTYLGVLVD